MEIRQPCFYNACTLKTLRSISQIRPIHVGLLGISFYVQSWTKGYAQIDETKQNRFFYGMF